jgi:hypothetical protein
VLQRLADGEEAERADHGGNGHVNLVANGIALATSLGSKFDVDALLRLVHTGIDPPQ